MPLGHSVTALKISVIPQPAGNWLQLEGSLSGSWVGELEQIIDDLLKQSPSLTLDLELWYVDLEGAAFLRALAVRAVIPVNASEFISRQLEIPNGDESSS